MLLDAAGGPASSRPRAPDPSPYPLPSGELGTLHRPDWDDVDEAALAEGNLLCPLEGLLLGVGLDQVEAAEGLLGLGKGAVHDLALSGLEAHAAGVAIRAQALAHD